MNFMFGFMRQEREYTRLEILRDKLKPATIRGVKHCVKCGFCCHCRTCIPTPNELKKIAKFLKLTPIQLIKRYYAIDRFSSDNIYYVKPVGINIKDLAGKFIPSERTFNEGPCIFLRKSNLCKIYPVRPKSARNVNCWEEKEGNPKKLIKFWEGNQLLKQFKIDGDKLESQGEGGEIW